MTDHVDRDDLQDFVYRYLPEESMESVREHLQTCEDCRTEETAALGEQEAIQGALAAPKIEGQELDRLVTDILDNPSGGLVGPRGRAGKKVRDPLSAAILRAVPVGVISGILTFLLFMIAWEQWISPPPATQDEIDKSRGPTTGDIRKSVNTFLEGNRAESLKAKQAILDVGESAIRVLYEERGGRKWSEFERITELMYTLRFQGVTDEWILESRDRLARSDCLARISASVSQDPDKTVPDGPGAVFDINPNIGRVRNAFDSIASAASYRGPMGLAYDTSVIPEKLQKHIPKLDSGSNSGYSWKAYMALEYFTAELGLDYRFRYGALIISTPARLWPYPKDDRDPLSAEAMQAHLAALDAEGLEARQDAQEALLGGGLEVVKFLRKNKADTKEGQARHRDILAQLVGRYSGYAFDEAYGLGRQKLDENGRSLAEEIGASSTGEVDFEDQRLDTVLSRLSKETGITVKHPGLIADFKITLAIGKGSLQEALMLLCKLNDLDFCIKDGAIWVDTKENIGKLLTK